MRLASLKRIQRHLRKVFRELQDADVKDNSIRHRYAEFLVAAKLAERGHDVQILGERDDKEADIYLPRVDKRIEVKSSKVDQDGWAYASFGKGRQISDRMFDCCVLVTFTHENENVKEILVFTRNELKEVARRRKNVARHENTNPCGMMYAPSTKEFQEWTSEKGVKVWPIELKLSKNPKKYREAWRRVGL